MKKLAVLLVAALFAFSFAAATWVIPTVSGEAHFSWQLSPMATPADNSADNTGAAYLDYSISVDATTSGFTVYGANDGFIWWKPIDMLKLTFGTTSFSGLEDPIATAGNGYSTPYKSVSLTGVLATVSQDMFTVYVGTTSKGTNIEAPLGVVVNPVEGVSFASLSSNVKDFTTNGDVEFALDLNKLASIDAAVKGVYRLADKSYQVYVPITFEPVSETVTVTGSPLDISSTTGVTFDPVTVSLTVSPLASPLTYSAAVSATLGDIYGKVTYDNTGKLYTKASYTFGDLKVGGNATVTGDKSVEAYVTQTLDSGATLTLDGVYDAGLTLTLKADAEF